MIYDYSRCVRLSESGLSHSEISRSMHISRPTIAKILARAEQLGLTYEKMKDQDTEALHEKMFPSKAPEESRYEQPDFKYVHAELAKKGVTLKLLQNEYRNTCVRNGKKAYMYTRFCQLYAIWAFKKKLIMRHIHKPGDAGEIDWAGLKPCYLDPDTLDTLEGHVFVFSLPYSTNFYYDVFPDEQIDSFLKGNIDAVHFFGGVPRILRPDNMKTAVASHNRLNISLNKSYEAFSDYYDTAIVPTRVRHPKDKSNAETTVGIVERNLIAPLRNEKPVGIDALRKRMRELYDEYMSQKVPFLECTRQEYYEREEKPFMKPIPQEPYRPTIWMVAQKVGNDYLICADGNHYSVPYTYVQQKVDVCLDLETVKVFHRFKLIAEHQRKFGKQRFPIILPEHMSPAHRAVYSQSEESFRTFAEGVGPGTLKVFDYLFKHCKEPEQVFPYCASLQNLAKKYGGKRLEKACAAEISMHSDPDLLRIDEYVKNPDTIPVTTDSQQDEVPASRGLTRGASHFSSASSDVQP